MKHLLLASLLLVPAARAQTAPVVYRYCSLVVDDRLFDYPGTMRLYYGRLKAKDPDDEVLAAAEKQIRKADNVIFALNYLSTLGWECFNVTTVPNSRGGIGAETRYLFRQPKP